MATTDTWPFFQAGTNLTLAFDYDGSGNQIYVGWAPAGTAQASTGWRIMKQVFNASNQVTDIQWPSASPAFNFIWNSRTTYTYS